MILTTKKKGFYILNIFNNNSEVNLDDKILGEIHSIISKIKDAKTRIALDLSNVSAITSIDFLSFINSNNLNILSLSPHLLAWLSLASKGFLPPVFLSEADFISKKRQFVKRNFYIV